MTESPIEQIRSVLEDFDNDAMVMGFAVVVEWLELDGTQSMSILHTETTPWHLHGLMTYARDYHMVGTAVVVDDE